MDIPERPDLNGLGPAVRAYVEALEAELERLPRGKRHPSKQPTDAVSLEPAEPPTTLNVIAIRASGLAKRTPRHLYAHQRRGGMGVFDLNIPQEDPIASLTIADESQALALNTEVVSHHNADNSVGIG